MKTWTKVHASKTDLEGPYECSECNGHIMLDATFIDQVSENTLCPYCQSAMQIAEVIPVDRDALFKSFQSITRDEDIPREFVHIGTIGKVYPDYPFDVYRTHIWENPEGFRIATWDRGNGYCDFLCEGSIESITAYFENE